jgi:hypothetical protein
MPIFPHVTVQLTGKDGNACAIIGRTAKAMRDAGVDNDAIADYTKKAMAGDYDNVLSVTMDFVTTR